MKKRALILCMMTVLVLPSMTLLAQKPDPVMDEGSMTIGVGAGPGTDYWGNGWSGFGPGIKVFFEAGMWKLGPGVLTLGGEYGFSYFTNNAYDGYKWHLTNMMFGARSAYHYGFDVPGLDCYAGMPLGFGFAMYNYDNYLGKANSTSVFPYVGIFFGTSYFFTDVIGINGEVGYNVTYANIGMIFKLK
jgi:hypothetical protein